MMLDEYINANRERPFSYGDFDCTIFTADWIKLCGVYVPDFSRGYSTEYGAFVRIIRTAKTMGCISLVDLLDKCYRRVNHVPPTGSIGVLDNNTPMPNMGIIMSDRLVTTGGSGLEFVRLNPESNVYWVIN